MIMGVCKLDRNLCVGFIVYVKETRTFLLYSVWISVIIPAQGLRPVAAKNRIQLVEMHIAGNERWSSTETIPKTKITREKILW